MDIRLHFVFALVISIWPCLAEVRVSKACFGSTEESCVKHTLRCSNGHIAIQQAFYMIKKACPNVGRNCTNFNVNSIEIIGETNNFSDSQLDLLCRTCSTKSACSFQSTRIGTNGNFAFSAIKYKCIDGSVNGCTEGQSSITTSTLPTSSANEDGNGGAIAGGVTAVIIICIIVVGVIFWLKFIRNKKKDQKNEHGTDNCALAGSASITDVQHVGSRKTTSNYDYTTINHGVNPVGRTQNHYFPAGKPSTDDGTTVPMEADYNRINHNPPQGASFPWYDTTASAAAAVKKLKNASSSSIEDDDYNHLGEGKPSVVYSDYDTTVSASKAVAQLGEMKDSEDDYDRFKRSEDRVINSPYDTANHDSSVSADTTPNPYNLAK